MTMIGKNPAIQLDTVIFATDFSSASHNAGLYASAIAMRFSAKLVVTHAFILSQAALEVEAERPLGSRQRIELNRDLTLAAHTLPSGKGTTEAVLLEGDPCFVVDELAQRRDPALTVLGTHGRGLLDRYFLGSIAEGILSHSTGPVLTVGDKRSIPHAGILNIRRVLYATDCTPEAARAAPLAVALADAFAAELDVVNVVHSSDIDSPEQIYKIQHHFYGAIKSVLPQDVDEICKPNTYVSVGNPQTNILKHIQEREIDLLVVGLHKNKHLGMNNRTSGIFPIIIKSKCPVITVASGPKH